MHTVGLTWQHAGEAAAVLAAVGGALSWSPRRPLREAGALLREVAVVGVLYGLWHLLGRISVTDGQQAFTRAWWIERVERGLHLPSERATQQLVLGHPLVVQAANLYYAAMHLTVMVTFLFWLFLRHRDRYRPVRQVMAWTTLGCLLIQLLPVAPPRMLPGIVDTGLVYDQSVYNRGLRVDQLSTMPSVHVAWAVCVGYYVWRISPSRWRFVGPAHAVVTVLVVVVTGNHFWLDGAVAVAVLVVCAWGVWATRTGWRRVVRPLRSGRLPAGSPAAARVRSGGQVADADGV